MKHSVTTPANSYPVSFDEVRNHLRLDNLDDKPYLDTLIANVTDIAQDELETSLLPQTITATFYDGDIYKGRAILPRGPVASITSVTANGSSVAASAYELRRVGNKDFLYFSGGTPTGTIVIVYSAGESTVPPRIKQAILSVIASLYDNREAYTAKPLSEFEAAARRIFDRARRTSLVG